MTEPADEKDRVTAVADELRLHFPDLSPQRAYPLARNIRKRVVRDCGPEVPELVGLSEAAEMLDSATGNVQRIVGFPEPAVRRKKGGSLWLADEIRELAEKRRAAA